MAVIPALLARYRRPNTEPKEGYFGPHWFRRSPASPGSSGSSGGGRGGAGSPSSSTSGSRGGTGSSGSTSTGGSTSVGGTVSGGRAGASSPSAYSSSQLSSAQRGQFYGASYSYGAYGYGRPYAGGRSPIYGFWPIFWTSDTPDGAPANNDTRPGGPLTPAGLQPPGGGNGTYVIYGDQQSVQVLVPVLNQNCMATNATAPADLSQNTTLQNYRDDSFALYRFNIAASLVNTTFETCLNDTIGDNLLIAKSHSLAAPTGAACLISLIAGLMLLKV